MASHYEMKAEIIHSTLLASVYLSDIQQKSIIILLNHNITVIQATSNSCNKNPIRLRKTCLREWKAGWKCGGVTIESGDESTQGLDRHWYLNVFTLIISHDRR